MSTFLSRKAHLYKVYSRQVNSLAPSASGCLSLCRWTIIKITKLSTGSIIYPYVITLYLASVVVGIGAALIWTAQGNFLTINSDESTMGRNSGIFWAILQCSLLFGNMFVYFYFKGKHPFVAGSWPPFNPVSPGPMTS